MHPALAGAAVAISVPAIISRAASPETTQFLMAEVLSFAPPESKRPTTVRHREERPAIVWAATDLTTVTPAPRR